MTVAKTVLDSGVTVISEQLSWLRSATVGIWVPSGSRAEPVSENGISHFIEHMLFKGTGRRTAADISREIESVGGTMNASTDREYTFFFAKSLEKDFPLVADLLCDIFLDSRFDMEELEREKGVVLQEILMAEDSPEDDLDDFFNASYWKGHPIGLPIQGRPASVSSFDRERVVRYFGDRFRRCGTIVSVVGNLAHDRVVEGFAGALGAMRLGERLPPDGPPSPERGVFLKKRRLGQVHIALGAPGVSRTSGHKYVAGILNALLGGNMSSRLFQEVREKRGLAYSIYSGLSAYSDSGLLKIYAGTSRELAREVLEVTAEVIASVRDGRFEDAEVLLAKEQIKGNLLLNLESAEYRMARLAMEEMYEGRLEPPEEALRRVDEVTPDDVRRLAASMLERERFSLAAVGDLPARPRLSF
jgi:predicted Zn-dependent peptidase